MADKNKHNLIYFEGDTMRELYDIMEDWQKANNKRLLSANIQKDQDKFCCIALSNPTEVIICDGSVSMGARVSMGKLLISTGL